MVVSAETMLLLILGGAAVIVAVRWVAERTGLPAAALLTSSASPTRSCPGPTSSCGPSSC